MSESGTVTPATRNRYLLPAIVVVIAAVAFAGGMETEKLTGKKTTATQANRMGGYGGGFGGRQGGERPTFGTVSSINGSTMVIQDSRGGGTTTVTLTSSTTYTTSDGSSASESAIATGDTVAVTGTTSNGTVTATSVRINPSFGGGMGGATPDSGSSSSDDANGST